MLFNVQEKNLKVPWTISGFGAIQIFLLLLLY